MRITNQAVLVLIAIFVVLGLFLLPFETYLWRLLSLVIVLVIGIVLNAAGVMGAGDAKFAAAAAPFIAMSDLRLLMMLFMATLLAAAATHRGVKYTPAPPRPRLAKLAGNQEIPHGPRPWCHTGPLSHSGGDLRRLRLFPTRHKL